MYQLGHSELKMTSESWYNEQYKDKCVIMDPDGWNRQDWEYSWTQELITHQEFTSRLCRSTVLWNTEKL